MKINLSRITQKTSVNVAIKCPHCGHQGTFIHCEVADVGSFGDANKFEHYLGIRRCPNHDCMGHLFFIADYRGKVIQTWPVDTISFERENIPPTVLAAFEEAVKCHANSCFVASAIMIRKTLEEICSNKGAEGKDLYRRLQALGQKIVLPQELLSGMNELRLLGNDAAHIEAQTFNEIGQNEIEVSLDFTKEILKAVYQYESLLQKIRNLRKSEQS